MQPALSYGTQPTPPTWHATRTSHMAWHVVLQVHALVRGLDKDGDGLLSLEDWGGTFPDRTKGARSHTVHLPRGALLVTCTMCGTGTFPGLAESEAATQEQVWNKGGLRAAELPSPLGSFGTAVG